MSLPLRFALRELRSGLKGFYVFISCIALGAMAISGVSWLAASLAESNARTQETAVELRKVPSRQGI